MALSNKRWWALTKKSRDYRIWTVGRKAASAAIRRVGHAWSLSESLVCSARRFLLSLHCVSIYTCFLCDALEDYPVQRAYYLLTSLPPIIISIQTETDESSTSIHHRNVVFSSYMWDEPVFVTLCNYVLNKLLDVEPDFVWTQSPYFPSWGMYISNWIARPIVNLFGDISRCCCCLLVESLGAWSFRMCSRIVDLPWCMITIHDNDIYSWRPFYKFINTSIHVRSWTL